MNEPRRFYVLKRIGLGIGVVHIVLILCNLFTGWYFRILPDGSYQRGSLYLLTVTLLFAIIVLCSVRILIQEKSRRNRFTLLSYAILPAASTIILAKYHGFTVPAVSTFFAIVIVRINYYLRRSALISLLNHELTESRLKSLQMQINPHFLFNTLHSAAGLCDEDPKATQEMIYLLADYMRDAFTDIEKPSMVTLREELSQLDHYLAIEAIRFPNISVEKEI